MVRISEGTGRHEPGGRPHDCILVYETGRSSHFQRLDAECRTAILQYDIPGINRLPRHLAVDWLSFVCITRGAVMY